MALPQMIDVTRPAGIEALGLGARRIREIKQAMIDIFGLPSASNVTTAPMNGTSAGLTNLTFRDSAASPTTAGRLQRSARMMKFHDGSFAQSLLATYDFDGGGGVVGNTAGGALTILHVTTVLPQYIGTVGQCVEFWGAAFFGAAVETKNLYLNLDDDPSSAGTRLNDVTAGPESKALRVHGFLARTSTTDLTVWYKASLDPGSVEEMEGIGLGVPLAAGSSAAIALQGSAATANSVVGQALLVRPVA